MQSRAMRKHRGVPSGVDVIGAALCPGQGFGQQIDGLCRDQRKPRLDKTCKAPPEGGQVENLPAQAGYNKKRPQQISLYL